MKKIPTVFRRDPEDMKRVLPEVTPGCEWVLAGEGVATRKYDGTCVALLGGAWWTRREVKDGKPAPEGFLPIGYDPATGKTVGWLPAEQSGWWGWLREAISVPGLKFEGTYELVGPKINGNPEGLAEHALISHADAERLDLAEEAYNDPFATLRNIVLGLGEGGWEGIVWHHPDGRMAKLKARDFRA